MRKQNFNNFIVSALILSLVIQLPYITFVRKAEAQVSGNYSVGVGYQSGGGIGGYLSGLAPTITQLPLCKNKINGAIKDLFSKSGTEAIDAAKKYIMEDTTKYEGTLSEDDLKFLEGKEKSASFEVNAVPTYDQEANKKLDKQDKKLDKIQETTKSLEENDTCLKSIGRLIIKMLLQKMTLSTVEWIQNGYHGKPSFVQDPSTFFKDIAKNEILQFSAEINNPTLYPFGKAFLKSQAEAFNSHFAENARYSLNELIQNTTPQYSAFTFREDFSQGGWNAWTALTSVPANNPLGFQLMASSELQRRLEGTNKSRANEIRDSLAQASGYLGDERCANPRNLSKEEHNAGLIERASNPTGPYQNDICTQWEYVTPGKMVSEAATKIVNYPDNNLLKAEDLNDAMAAILDAVLARFSADLYNKGFADFSSEGINGSFIVNNSNVLEGSYSQVEQDFSRFQRGSVWIQQHPNFNIRTDITQALIDEQRIYRNKLEKQNEVLRDLNKTIYQLDYCIPGPHPGWERDSRRILSAVENSITSKTISDMTNVEKEEILGMVKTAGYAGGAAIGSLIGIGAAAGSVLPVVGTLVGAAIGLLVGYLINQFSGPSPQELLTLYYGSIIGLYTGIPVDVEGEGSSKIMNKHEVTRGLDAMLYKYGKLIKKYFTPEYLPPVAKDAAKEFRKTIGYNQIIADNNDNIILINGIIKRLANIKNGIDELNAQLSSDPTEEELNQYEKDLIPFISEFSRLSSNMVTGDDIAIVDNLTKEAQDEIKYVYNDLLTGKYGCERDLRDNYRTTPANPEKTWILRATKRAIYPFDIWYDYSDYAPDAKLPVPQELIDKGYTDKTPEDGNLMPEPDPNIPNDPAGGLTSDVMGYGPGFLSAVYYNYNSSNSNSGYFNPNDIGDYKSSKDPSLGGKDYGNAYCGAYLASVDNSEINYLDVSQLPGNILDCMNVVDVWKKIDARKIPTVGRKQYDGVWENPDTGEILNLGNEQKDTSFEQTIGIY